jgi:hypothetical protein
MRLSVRQALLAPSELGQLALDLLLRGEHTLLDLGHVRSPLGQLPLNLCPQPDRLFAGLDLCLTADRLDLALGLRQQQIAHLARRADAKAPESAERDDDGERREEDDPDDADDFEHPSSWVDSGCPRQRRGSSLGTRPAQTSWIGSNRAPVGPGARLQAVCRTSFHASRRCSYRSHRARVIVGTDSENASYAGKMSDEASSS